MQPVDFHTVLTIPTRYLHTLSRATSCITYIFIILRNIQLLFKCKEAVSLQIRDGYKQTKTMIIINIIQTAKKLILQYTRKFF